jgi:hypothetical protein
VFRLIENGEKNLKTGFPITQAVVDGSQAGSIYHYMDNYFVIHKSDFCSFIQRNECDRELISLFKQDEIPKYFHIYDVSEGLIETIRKESEFNYKIRGRMQFSFLESHPVQIDFLAGFHSEQINDLNFELLAQFNLDLGNRYWRNKTEFINSANGVVIMDNQNRAVGICYAAAIGDNKAEVDVLTIENSRGKGIAKLAVSNFINNCIKQSIIPNWDCFEDNFASVKTAEQFSFRLEKRYKLMSIFKKDINEN